MTVALQYTTIEARFVDAPQPGRKNWSVKDANNQKYSVPSMFAGILQPGGRYDIGFRVAMFNGRPINMVESVQPAGQQQQQSPQQLQQPQYALTPQGREIPQQKKYMPPATGYSGPNKDEQIFVTACLARFIQSGQVEPSVTSIVTMVMTIREAWAQSFGNKQINPELNDEIPFP